jgi:hypothetical protein
MDDGGKRDSATSSSASRLGKKPWVTPKLESTNPAEEALKESFYYEIDIYYGPS